MQQLLSGILPQVNYYVSSGYQLPLLFP